MNLLILEKVALFLTLLLLPTQLGKHFWPDLAYIHSIKIDYLSPVIYFWDTVVIILLCTWLIRKPVINRRAMNLLYFFLLTQGVFLLGCFYTKQEVNLVGGLLRLEQYLIAGLFGVYLSSSKFEHIKEQLHTPLAIAVLFESILAVLQVIKGGSLGFWIFGERTFSLSTLAIAKFDFYGRQFLRPYATFPHPNVLGAFLVTVVPLLAHLSLASKRLINIKIFLPLATVAIFTTVSRVVFIGLLMEIIFFMNKRLLLLSLFILFFLAPIIFTRFSSTFNFDDISLFRREDLNESAVNLFIENPLLGVGVNNFIPRTAENVVSGPTRFLQPVHNIFLLTLAETGLVGFVGLAVLIGYPFAKLIYLRNNQEAHLFILLWILIIFLGMFDHYFLTLPQGYRIFFLVWGLSLSVVESK